MKGLYVVKSGEYFRKSFQSGFMDKNHAIKVLGFKGDPSEVDLVEVEGSVIEAILPKPEPEPNRLDVIESRVSALELIVLGEVSV